MDVKRKQILANLRKPDSIDKERIEYNEEVDSYLQSAIKQIRKVKEKLMSATQDKYSKVGKPLGKARIKILSLSDFHVPYDNEETILHALENHADADILVINGDFLEQYAISRWGKSKTLLLEWEYKIAIEWMKLFVSMFEEVHLVRGNHDDRLQKYISAAVDPMVNFMIEDDVLVKIAEGYDFNNNGKLEKKYDFSNVYYTPGLLGWMTKIGKCIFAHPSSSSGVPMRTVIQAATSFTTNEDFQALVIGHCFDEETELLTNNGWKDIDTISEKDNPLTLNLETNKLEYNDCEGVYKHTEHKELVSFKNNTGLEVMVTPEHGMIYSNERNLNKTQAWKKANAEEIEKYDRITIPASGILDNKENDKVSDELIKILAWIVTEGNIGYTTAKNPVIRIAQSDDGSGFLREIEKLLDLLEIKYSTSKRYDANTTKHGTHRNYDAYRIYIGIDGSSVLAPYLNMSNKTFDHDFMMSLSFRQRKILIEEMCKGDGSKCGTDHYCHYYTANEDLLNQFQTLCTLSGIRNKANIKRDDGTWVVSMTDSIIHTITKTERVSYDGRTWCLTVPNGTLVARRNGVVFLTQNTHKMGTLVWRDKLLIEQGCCCVPLDYQSDGKMKYLPQAFGYAVVYMDEYGNVDFENTRTIYRGTGYPTKEDME
jgi:predicted phosphodiesterase